MLESLLMFAQAELSRCRMLGDISTHFLEKEPTYRQSCTFMARGGESEDESDINYGFKVQEEPDCDACDGQHLLKRCPTFLAMIPQERLELMIEKRRCFRCLRLGHGANTCSSTSKCQVCERRHHSLLHGATMRRGEETRPEQALVAEIRHGEPDLPIKVVGQSLSAAEEDEVSLGTVPVRVRHGNVTIEINALLDNGNTTNLLSEEAARVLGIDGRKENAIIEGVGGQKLESKRGEVTLTSIDGNVKAATEVRIVPSPAGSLRAVDWNVHKAKFLHLKQMSFPEPCQRRSIDLILGNRVGKLTRSTVGDVYGQEADDPVARKTPLGWVVAGKLHPHARTEKSSPFRSYFAADLKSTTKKVSCHKEKPSRGADVPSMVDRRTRVKGKKRSSLGAAIPSMVGTRTPDPEKKKPPRGQEEVIFRCGCPFNGSYMHPSPREDIVSRLGCPFNS